MGKRKVNSVTIEEFDYDLPEELIAQTPIEPRDHSRLLVLHRSGGRLEHRYFYNLIDYLNPGDLLVINDSKVIPARIFGTRAGTGGLVEVLLLKALEENIWEVLVRPGRKARPGQILEFQENMTGTILEILEDGKRKIRFSHQASSIYEILDRIGKMPLPPYITEQLQDQSRYQTVYARETGSAARAYSRSSFYGRDAGKDPKKGDPCCGGNAACWAGHISPCKGTGCNTACDAYGIFPYTGRNRPAGSANESRRAQSGICGHHRNKNTGEWI